MGHLLPPREDWFEIDLKLERQSPAIATRELEVYKRHTAAIVNEVVDDVPQGMWLRIGHLLSLREGSLKMDLKIEHQPPAITATAPEVDQRQTAAIVNEVVDNIS